MLRGNASRSLQPWPSLRHFVAAPGVVAARPVERGHRVRWSRRGAPARRAGSSIEPPTTDTAVEASRILISKHRFRAPQTEGPAAANTTAALRSVRGVRYLPPAALRRDGGGTAMSCA